MAPRDDAASIVETTVDDELSATKILDTATAQEPAAEAAEPPQILKSHPWFSTPPRGTQAFVILPSGNRSRAYRMAKRAFDIAGALVLLACLWPLLLGTYLVLFVTTKGHPTFWQDRVGLCGKVFSMCKFRTMVMNADKLQHLVKNEKDGPVFKNQRDPRITRLGRILRSTSIDELPQIFNVLRGDMSLVGPRPPVPAEVAKYEPWQRQRLTIKPGLTCLWQVSGRCEIGFEDWVRMDIWYQKNQSLGTDLDLLAKTPTSVISRRGAY